MNESNPSDAALAELLTLTMDVNKYGTTRYRNQQGQFHRVHGPAITRPGGTNLWWRNDRLHREDGPAIEYSDGDMMWYLNGEHLTEEEWNERVKSL